MSFWISVEVLLPLVKGSCSWSLLLRFQKFEADIAPNGNHMLFQFKLFLFVRLQFIRNISPLIPKFDALLLLEFIKQMRQLDTLYYILNLISQVHILLLHH
jgi:hypothetical protein